jgi:hypothetical protein
MSPLPSQSQFQAHQPRRQFDVSFFTFEILSELASITLVFFANTYIDLRGIQKHMSSLKILLISQPIVHPQKMIFTNHPTNPSSLPGLSKTCQNTFS